MIIGKIFRIIIGTFLVMAGLGGIFAYSQTGDVLSAIVGGLMVFGGYKIIAGGKSKNEIQQDKDLEGSDNLQSEKTDQSSINMHKSVLYPNIGGFLVIVAIALIITSFSLLIHFLTIMASIEEGVYGVFTNPTSEHYHPLWKSYITFQVIKDGSAFLFFSILTVLFFMRKRIVPKLIIVGLIVIWVISMLQYYLYINYFHEMILQARVTLMIELDTTHYHIRNIFGNTLRTFIGVPYFIISKRVKGTFVN